MCIGTAQSVNGDNFEKQRTSIEMVNHDGDYKRCVGSITSFDL